MVESWDADKELHTALAVITALVIKNHDNRNALIFEWQKVADMVNKVNNCGLTGENVRTHVLHRMLRGFLKDAEPETPTSLNRSSLHMPYEPCYLSLGPAQDGLLPVRLVTTRVNHDPQEDQPQPQAAVSTAKDADEEGMLEPSIPSKAMEKRKAADEFSSPVAKKIKIVLSDDDDAADGGVESSPY
ncbi:hypothetical protein GL218_05638 [Daldinia childiae]|uniref:uncharacterized protein n=1 Tax=Daldinia childiae TaxID=326645 RepID=UPI0014467AFE|nr:uncharacterized protein GL218_05638 [Daldinia childiae]KAF3058675.1 hypothetical protein GL218_05638 [Daldinia childiae]